MYTWFKLLPLEIQEVDQLVEPQDEIKEGETPAGTISEILRKMYSLWKSTDQASELLAVELKYRKASDEDWGRLAQLKAKSHILSVLFWICVMDELNLWSHREQCAIREGWQIVEYQAGPPDIFRHLFGGMR